ncbi:ATP-binding response regulator [Flavobacterium sp. W20_MBD1_R3]|uniref:ATP-binding response regulator n=1 Tax=Flavobacterium sp. W20_MBD1_R3 TaxID=3240278 RepID=UPI003F930891
MNKNKILLVDDELNIRETIVELLIYQNYDVKAAANGQEALDLLEYWVPDLIICDIMMPVMDGIVLHEIIQETESLSFIPFIFLTAKKENNLMRKCLLDGVDYFLSKPFKIKELLKIIETKIDRFEKIKNTHKNLYAGQKKYFLHEINTPLNGILGSIEILIKHIKDFDQKQVSEFYEAIKISGERLNRTMQNIILYQNLKNNLYQTKESFECEIAIIFTDVKTKLFQMHEDPEQRISYSVDEANLKIDKEDLHFILFELIDNALKFSEDGKAVIVSGKRYNDEYYEVVIKDLGIGFSEQELKKIGAAQQFKREEREQQGLGLGLFLSKMMIKRSNGVFSIISKEGEGSTVKIFLPLETIKSRSIAELQTI